MSTKRVGSSRFFTDTTTRTWGECQLQAATYGLTFASIHSDEERDTVISIGVEWMWIGGFRPGNGLPFEWDDGTVWDYEAWSPGEPSTLNELRVVANAPGNNLWHDWGGNTRQRCVFAEPVGRPSHNYITFSFLFFYALYFVEILILVVSPPIISSTKQV